MIVHEIFPTVVTEFDLSNSEAVKDVKSKLDEIQIESHGLVENGKSSYMNKINVLNQEKFLDLKNIFQECLDTYSLALGLGELAITNTWYNVMSTGSKTILHRHEGSVCSGAFYPYADADSVDLTFHSPLKPLRMNELFFEQNNFNYYTYSVPAKPNTLYLFPSWLEHETDYNKSNERYVISFNTDRPK